MSADDPDLRELVTIIECDPTISLQLMRVANSAVYGFPGQIKSVNHAVVILGFREVRNVALALASGEVFGQGKGHGKELWRHSLGCAAVARCLAKHVEGASADEAFLGGILHDIGKLIFIDAIPDQYIPATKDLDPFAISEVEADHFGITHQEVGQICADEWGLPLELNDVIGGHHVFADDPSMESENMIVVRSANYLARLWGLGTPVPQQPPAAEADALNLHLTPEELLHLRAVSMAAYQGLHRTCC
jgi:putative nucleotidyltransferase with HDIG domain